MTRASLLERFDRFIITEDVRVEDWSGRLARIGLHGPAAASVLADALPAEWTGPDRGQASVERLAGLDEQANVLVPGPVDADAVPATFDVAPGHVLIVGTREGGVPGLDLFMDPVDETRLSDALVARGARPVDPDTWNVVRVEAATPVFGADMDEDTIPLEAGIEDRAISFTKGCYVGQEVIVRVRDRGHGRVARRLVGLAAPAEGVLPVVAPGDRLRAGDRDVGRVTSAAFSPVLGRTVALGYVQRDLADPGTSVDAVHGAAVVPLVVVPTPFVAGGPGEWLP
jgi:folate-binding protein YgfZ